MQIKSLFSKPIYEYNKVQFFISLLRRNSKLQLNQSDNRKYLNVGCGANIYPQFVNLDWQWRPGVDYCWDILRGLPFSNEQFIGIYSEHCLEHLPFDRIQFVLSEFYRVLKAGGVARIVLPDGQKYIETYYKRMNGEFVEFPYENDLTLKTPMMHVNSVFRYHGHLYCYDFNTLKLLLEEIGFVNIVTPRKA